VVLAPCASNDSQQWLVRQDGRLVNTQSGRCLTPNTSDQGARLQIADCATGRSDQVWRLPALRGTTGKIAGPGGRCLDVKNGDPNVNGAWLWDCNPSTAQTWTAPGDGTLRGDGKCLDVTNGFWTDGNPVGLWECNASKAQEWVAQPDGTLVNPTSGRCLTAASTGAGALLSITNCVGGDNQMWRMSAATLTRGPIVGVGTKCLDIFATIPTPTGSGSTPASVPPGSCGPVTATARLSGTASAWTSPAPTT